jgi:phage shock protein PspC (stress-responsive transcriptional regulator)
MSLELILVGVLKGVAAGAGAAFIGYFKNKGESFEALKFTRTVIVGGITGGLAGGFGLDPQTIEVYLAYPLVVLGIDAAVKAISRRVVVPIYEKLKELIAKA